jgi:sugar lactone lactonase YvrE
MKHYYLPLAIAMILCSTIGCKKSQDSPNNPSGGTNTPLSITAISPTHGAGGTNIRIIGTGFSAKTANDSVKINGILAVVNSASDTALVVTIPIKAGSGTVTLTDSGKTATGPVLTYDTAWMVSTIAGSIKGYADATGSNAQFNKPNGVCVDKAGNVYVADMGNLRIRKITPAGVVTTLAGGTYGTSDGIGTAAQFEMPSYVAVDGQGILYISDSYANRVKKYDPATGAVTTIAGASGVQGRQDGPASSAQLYEPNGITVTADGAYVYFCDMGNNNIRLLDYGVVGTIAGNTCYSGHTDGPSRTATFQTPLGLCLDASGQNIYVADTYSQAIRKVSPINGTVTTIAGDTTRQGSKDGVGRAAQFFAPASICLAPNGNLYVADTYNHEIRQVTQDGVVTTIAGSTTSGNVDGIATSARFNTPSGINIDSQGALYIADTYNHTIRKMVRQ